jgi:tRNA pseudouridine32 synthase/23S rRNA pseudouridine746 synthase
MDFDWQSLILACDVDFVALNKPPGLLSLPHGYDPSQPYVRAVLEPHLGRLWIVHRLDKQASGVMVLARNAAAHRSLNTQFQEQTVRKRYHALVAGNPPWSEQEISLPLRVDADRRHRTKVDQQRGKPARTDVTVLQNFEGYALLCAAAHSGRIHQVRAHLAATGHPILGDALYGNPQHPAHALLPRLALHAHSLDFTHPGSGEIIYLEAPYPEDFAQALEAGNQDRRRAR